MANAGLRTRAVACAAVLVGALLFFFSPSHLAPRPPSGPPSVEATLAVVVKDRVAKKQIVYDTRHESVYGNKRVDDDEFKGIDDVPLYVRVECRGSGLSELGSKLRNGRRAIVIKNLRRGENVCLSGDGIADVLGACLSAITRMRVYAENVFDGTCAECSHGVPTACSNLYLHGPPALVVFLGTTEELEMRCAGSYCGKAPKEPVLFKGEDYPPSDFTGSCVVDDFVSRSSVFEVPEALKGKKYGENAAQEPTRYAWLPSLDPYDKRRVLWEQSRLFAPSNSKTIDWPLSTAPAFFAMTTNASAPKADFAFARERLDPAALKGLLEPITVLPGDALPSALLPDQIGDFDQETEARRHHNPLVAAARKELLWVGDISTANGQLVLLKKLPRLPQILEDMKIVLIGPVLDPDLMLQLEAQKRRLGPFLEHRASATTAEIAEATARASGVLDYSARPVNESRHIYEALARGLPVFTSQQSMAYIGLQCRAFVVLSDRDGSRQTLHRDLNAFTSFVNNTKVPPALAIAAYLRRDLTPNEIYRSLCERLGLCASRCPYRAEMPWSKGSCKHTRITRFENWVTAPFEASESIAAALRPAPAACAQTVGNPETGWWPRRIMGMETCGPNKFQLKKEKEAEEAPSEEEEGEGTAADAV